MLYALRNAQSNHIFTIDNVYHIKDFGVSSNHMGFTVSIINDKGRTSHPAIDYKEHWKIFWYTDTDFLPGLNVPIKAQLIMSGKLLTVDDIPNYWRMMNKNKSQVIATSSCDLWIKISPGYKTGLPLLTDTLYQLHDIEVIDTLVYVTLHKSGKQYMLGQLGSLLPYTIWRKINKNIDTASPTRDNRNFTKVSKIEIELYGKRKKLVPDNSFDCSDYRAEYEVMFNGQPLTPKKQMLVLDEVVLVDNVDSRTITVERYIELIKGEQAEIDQLSTIKAKSTFIDNRKNKLANNIELLANLMDKVQ